jgi:hypothetical protein
MERTAITATYVGGARVQPDFDAARPAFLDAMRRLWG